MLQSLLLAVALFVTPAGASAAGPADAANNTGVIAPATQPAPLSQSPLSLSPSAGAMTSASDPMAAPPASPTATANVFAGPTDVVQPAAENDSLYGVFRRTRVGELVEGKKRVTLDDVKNPLFWVDTLRDLAVAVLAFIPRLVVAGLFLIFFWIIYRTLRRLITGALMTAGVDASIRDMLAHLLKWAIMGFGCVIACNQIGVQIAALLTGVSIIGLAVGFAAKETIENFIAGIVIFWDKPFKIGDHVEIEGTSGRIQRVTFRSTRILDGAGKMVVFPNTQMLSKKLMNNSAHPLTAVKVVVGIAYQESIDDARRVLLGMFGGDNRVCRDPEPAVGVVECTPASVQLALSFWVVDETLEAALKLEYLEKAKKALDAASIEPTAPPAPPAPASATATTTTVIITPPADAPPADTPPPPPPAAPPAPASPALLAGPRQIRAAA